MNENEKISICPFPDENIVFMGMYTIEPCSCCGTEKEDDLRVMYIGDDRKVLCTACLNALYDKIGRSIHSRSKTVVSKE